MSEFTKILIVSPLGDGENWILREEFRYYDSSVTGTETNPAWIAVPPRFMTDYASVPAVARWLISKWGKHGNAAVLHDYLYWEQPVTGDRKTADVIFLEAMIVMGVSWWKRSLIYQSVRWFGCFAWGGNTKKRREGWNRVALRWPARATDTPEDLQVPAPPDA